LTAAHGRLRDCFLARFAVLSSAAFRCFFAARFGSFFVSLISRPNATLTCFCGEGALRAAAPVAPSEAIRSSATTLAAIRRVLSLP
jgi:hypothetical protein